MDIHRPHSRVALFQAAIEIRPALPEDAERIARTFLESAEYHAELDPVRYSTPTVETISARYREGRQHPSHAGQGIMTLVAELSGELQPPQKQYVAAHWMGDIALIQRSDRFDFAHGI